MNLRVKDKRTNVIPVVVVRRDRRKEVFRRGKGTYLAHASSSILPSTKHHSDMPQVWGLQLFLLHIENIQRYAGQLVFVTTTHLCCCSLKAVIENP